MERESTNKIALELAERAARPEPVTPGEYRKLFIKGLAALLREVDSIAYQLKQREKRT